MKSRKKSVACLLSALQPPATYFALALAGHYCSSLPVASLLVVVSLPPLFWFCSRQRHRFCGSAPAYVSVFGHFGTAVLTFIIKLFPFAGIGLGVLFCTTSCAFGLIFTRMIISDPGRVDDSHLEQQRGQAVENCSSLDESFRIDVQGRRHSTSRAYDNMWRGKYCQYCRSFIERYDHHCAAIENCVGSRNMGTFLLLLTTACILETLYLGCCYLYLKNVAMLSAKTYTKDGDGALFKNYKGLEWEANQLLFILFKEAWVLSIAVFVGLQILWQIPFLVFQFYLIGINLTTDEWVNWEEIPRFFKPTTSSELRGQSKTFANPYDEGFLRNYKSILNNRK